MHNPANVPIPCNNSLEYVMSTMYLTKQLERGLNADFLQVKQTGTNLNGFRAGKSSRTLQVVCTNEAQPCTFRV